MIRNKVVWDKLYYSNRFTVRTIFLLCYSRFRLIYIFNLNIMIFSSTGQRPVELKRYPFIRRRVVYPLTICCSSISSVTKYRRDPFMVSCCWPHGLVVHVQFWSSPDPMGPIQEDLVKKKINMYLRRLIMVLFCKIHDLVVHCASFVQSRCPGAPEGGIV